MRVAVELDVLTRSTFSTILLFLPGQFIPIGILGPIYFFSYYYYYCSLSPPRKLACPEATAISPIHAAAVLPAVALGYYLPHFPSYFHDDYGSRHWWNWIWQLYPVWGSIVFFVSTKVLAPVVVESGIRQASPSTGTSATKATLGVVALVNTATFWYTVRNAEVPAVQLFIPAYFASPPAEPHVVMRTIIQYDYLCSFGATILWLCLSIRDLKAAGSVRAPWVVILGATVIVCGVCGLGTAMLLLWAWREEVLAREVDGSRKDR